jgi:peptidoglycan/LPS O-acetylase OafA/YrhL
LVRRIPSLDGLRAISIGLVLVSHTIQALHRPTLARYTIDLIDLGKLGVRVFFVISGFLITNLLLAEKSKRGHISLPHFYLRRTLRIFPPYYALLLFVGMAAHWGALVLDRGDMFHAMTYTMNYHPERAWPLGHTWSLAVEEQFYLIWPAVLLWLGIDRGLWLAAGFVFLAPAIRLGLLAGTPKDFLLHRAVGNSFETVGDAIAIGCLLAGLRVWLWNRPVYRRILDSPGFVLVPLLIILFAAFPDTANTLWPGEGHRGVLALYHTVGILLINVGVGLVIDWSVRNAEGRVGRWLNTPVLAWIGTISYSLYLWQQIFLNPDPHAYAAHVPINVALVLLVSVISYYAIEQPGLRLRAAIERRWFARTP